MKKFLAIALVFVMVFSLAGCGGDVLAGTWKLDNEALASNLENAEGEEAFAGALMSLMDITMVLGADGTVEMTISAFGETQTSKGTYTTDGTTLTITGEDGTTSTSTYRFEGGKLILNSDGTEMVYVRG